MRLTAKKRERTALSTLRDKQHLETMAAQLAEDASQLKIEKLDDEIDNLTNELAGEPAIHAHVGYVG